MKSARFSLVVKKCGTPEIYLAWVDPKRDRTLKRALAENRVMTLHQELHGGKKDFGTVGFLKDRHAQILLFPKSLRRFAGQRIIAVDYALFAKGGMPVAGKEPEVPKKVRGKPLRQRPESAADLKPEKDHLTSSGKKGVSALVASPTKTEPLALLGVMAVVRRAVKELAAGKSIPAYERLKGLLKSQESSA